MKKLNFSKGSRHGGMAVAITAVVIAIVVLLNLIIGQLPSSILEFDFSNQHYSKVGQEAKGVISQLDTDIQLVLVAAEENIDPRISNYVYNCADISSHISVVQTDPVIYPSVLTQLNCSANSLVVINTVTGKSASIPLGGYEGYESGIINYDMYYGSESTFDADGQVAAAIQYVTSESIATVYALTGHSEASIPTGISDLITKANIQIGDDINMTEGAEIPEDCSLLICFNPSTDLSDDELAAIREYMANGGHILLLIDAHDLKNFNSLLNEYGLAAMPGYLGDTQTYLTQYANNYSYFCFMPVIANDSSITSGLTENAVVYYPMAMSLANPARSTISIEPFMSTSSGGIYLADENDSGTNGQYLLGAVCSEETDNGTSTLTVISAITLMDENLTSSLQGISNNDIIMNTITANMDVGDVVAIPAINMSEDYNVVRNIRIWIALFVFLIAASIICGLVIWLRRRTR